MRDVGRMGRMCGRGDPGGDRGNVEVRCIGWMSEAIGGGGAVEIVREGRWHYSMAGGRLS